MEPSSRPRILVITPRFPLPAIGGDKLRISKVIAGLAQHFDVDVFAGYSRAEELRALPELQQICGEVHVHRLTRGTKVRNTITGWLRGYPLQVAHYLDRAAQRQVAALLATRNYQVVLPHLVRSLEYARTIPPERVVLEMTDAIAMNYSRIRTPRTPMELLYLFERNRLARYERAATERVAAAVVVSPADRDYLRGLGAAGRIEVIGNGTTSTTNEPSPVGEVQPDTIAFLGNLRYAPNQDMVLRFARDILPMIWQQRPQAQFLVIGADPPRRIEQLHDGNRIVVTGTVPDPQQLLAAAAVSVCPMSFGAGVQNKILEAMAVGVPVVTTSAGLEGIAAQAGQQVLVADDDAGFADLVLAVLANAALRERLGVAGRQLVERDYRWDERLADYSALVTEVLRAAVQP